MFSSVKATSASRLAEVGEFLRFIEKISPKPPNPSPLAVDIAKGLFWVHLYGAYEYTVTTSVLKTIESINKSGHLLNECKPILFSLALHPECDALFSASDRKWEKRWALFSKIENDSAIQICDDVIPTNGGNYGYSQLASIWTSFCVAEPISPRPELQGRIKELVRNRNDIAHGNLDAKTVGRLNSISNLKTAFNDINELSSYIILSLENHVIKSHFLKDLTTA